MIFNVGTGGEEGSRQASVVVGNRRKVKQTRTRALAAAVERKESLGGRNSAGPADRTLELLRREVWESRKDAGGQRMARHRPREAVWQRGKFHFTMLLLLGHSEEGTKWAVGNPTLRFRKEASGQLVWV